MQLRSALPTVVFPALIGGQAAELMAVQRQFDDSQWWPPERMQAAQFGQLSLLLRHATRQIPLYGARLRAARIDPEQPLTREAWQRLAPLTRKDVQRAGARLHARTLPQGHGETSEVATGGSSGVPVRVRRSALDGLLGNAVHVREELWHREDPMGDVLRLGQVPTSLSAGQIAQANSPGGLTFPDWGTPLAQLWATGKMHLLEATQPVAAQVAFLLRHRPAYLHVLPSTLRLLLAHCRDAGIALPGLRAVWTVSEPVDDSLRALCRDVAGVRIVHNYTAAETGWMALQCPSCDGFHVQSEVCLLEVLDDANRQVAPGETGRVVVTPLHGFAMPLLRYDIGDEAEWGGPCACGRGLPVLTRIVGRTGDALTLPDGRRRGGGARAHDGGVRRGFHGGYHDGGSHSPHGGRQAAAFRF